MDVDPQQQQRGLSGGTRVSTPSGSQTLVQVCDRCRWKKIKCDGARPCSNCRTANFPCETRARLSKQATPRSYVQYLESRVRELEGQRDTDRSPQASTSRSPYGDSQFRAIASPDLSQPSPKHGLPDWTVLKELGTHVVDDDGLSRYMGPSSGVGFCAKVLEIVLDDDQPSDADFYSLFSLDDLSRSRQLAETDYLLWQLMPTNLPDRAEANYVLNNYFLFTERVFPLLHRPTFLIAIDQLYQLENIGTDNFEILAQFYFTLSIGYGTDTRYETEERVRYQIHALQNACRCYFTALHTRREGLARLQTFALHSYALLLLRQRSESLRVSSMANTKALECGLHHDGRAYAGNPLETEMRRRVFWCVFMLHLFNCAVEGLPRSLHEVDITIAEPSDIDDEQLTTTGVRNTAVGRTKIHRFVAVCRLVRILSRTLDVLYSHNKRKQASLRIEQMNRLCCEHLLDQLDFSSEEIPDDIPENDTNDYEKLAVLASWVNEQLLYYYIRWLIYRPGLSLQQSEPTFGSSLQLATEAAAAMTRIANENWRAMPFIRANPVVLPPTVFITALTPIYRSALLKSGFPTIPMINYDAAADLESAQRGLSAMVLSGHDKADFIRQRVLRNLMAKVFGESRQEPLAPAPVRSSSGALLQPKIAASTVTRSPQFPSELLPALKGPELEMTQQEMIDVQEQQIEHATAQEDLRSFVHEAFSPSLDPWFAEGGFVTPRPM